LRNARLKKKKLVICGESFSYSKHDTDWPNLVSERINYELHNFAIVGCSNIAICYQLEKALSLVNKEDLIIISLTAAERFEIDSDEFSVPATYDDFRQNIDEIDYSSSSKEPTIVSGNIASQIRNADLNYIKKYLIPSSYRLNAQKQAWSLNYLISKLPCKYLLYRNIYPRFHDEISNYNEECYFGLENYINSGPYDFEKEHVKSTNHLSTKENKVFANKVVEDIYEYCI